VEVSVLGTALRIPYSLVLFASAFVPTVAITPLVIALSRRVGAMDHPGPRRIHEQPVPTLGGLAMALSVLGAAWIAYLTNGPVSSLDPRPLTGLTLASLPILVLGVIDDVRGVPPWAKLATQALGAVILTEFGLGIPVLSLPWGASFPAGPFDVPLTILWVLVVTNSINLIDGLDGLATGAVFIASMTLWWVGRHHEDPYVMFLTATLAGATAAFLIYNFPPAKIFMGDTGSQFLGFALATLSLVENRKGTTTVTLLFPLLAMGLPILDGVVSFTRRVANKRPVFTADSGHLHHRLLHIGLSKRSTLFVLWYLCAYLGVMAILLAALPRSYSGFVLVLLAMGLYLAFAVLEFVDRRVSGRARREDDPR
jgi:UDP-GlcNAc:undecaprenyl-phosphate GlcNAc-1-phosphate transferase